MANENPNAVQDCGCNVRELHAEIERLTEAVANSDDRITKYEVAEDQAADDLEQAQARVKRLEVSCETMLSYLEYALGPGDGLYLAHDTQTLPAEIAKMKTALAEGGGDADPG